MSMLRINLMPNYFADTDSLVYEIKRKDVYEECFKDRDLFDFS